MQYLASTFCGQTFASTARTHTHTHSRTHTHARTHAHTHTHTHTHSRTHVTGCCSFSPLFHFTRKTDTKVIFSEYRLRTMETLSDEYWFFRLSKMSTLAPNAPFFSTFSLKQQAYHSKKQPNQIWCESHSSFRRIPGILFHESWFGKVYGCDSVKWALIFHVIMM